MNDEDKGFRVSNIFYYILRGRRLIAICALVGLIVGVIISGINYLRGEMSKEYQITSSIAIIAQTRSGTYASTKNNPDTDDVRLAQEITDSAIYVLRSERTLAAAIESSHLEGITVKDIQSNLTLSQYNETQIIEMTLYWRSNAEGVRVLEAINNVSGEILLDTLKIGNVSVVNSPSSKYIIGGSVNASTWVICALLGAVLAAAICVLKLFISPLLTNGNDIEELFSMEVLGSIAYDKEFGESEPFADDGSKAKKDIVSLAHILANRLSHLDYRKVMLTSSIHGEGNTSLTVNIAQQMAASGKKTLMVDCDFKNPKLSSLFDGHIPYEKTLNAVYFGDADDTDAICHITGCLDLLPVVFSDDGISLNDPMLEVIDKIAQRYEFVIFDCAPVGIDAEVINLKKIVDTALFVVRFDYAELEDIEKAAKRLTGSGVETIGCAITSVKTIKDILKEAQKISLFMRRKKGDKITAENDDVKSKTKDKKKDKKKKKNKKEKREKEDKKDKADKKDKKNKKKGRT